MTDPAPVAAAEKIEMLPAPTAKVAALPARTRKARKAAARKTTLKAEPRTADYDPALYATI